MEEDLTPKNLAKKITESSPFTGTLDNVDTSKLYDMSPLFKNSDFSGDLSTMDFSNFKSISESELKEMIQEQEKIRKEKESEQKEIETLISTPPTFDDISHWKFDKETSVKHREDVILSIGSLREKLTETDKKLKIK